MNNFSIFRCVESWYRSSWKTRTNSSYILKSHYNTNCLSSPPVPHSSPIMVSFGCPKSNLYCYVLLLSPLYCMQYHVVMDRVSYKELIRYQWPYLNNDLLFPQVIVSHVMNNCIQILFFFTRQSSSHCWDYEFMVKFCDLIVLLHLSPFAELLMMSQLFRIWENTSQIV